LATIDQITAPSLTYSEGAAPATPAASKVIVYAKADGLMYSKDDAGTETALGAGFANPMTTQGDIMYEGAAAPARLAKGTAGQVLRVNAGATAPEWVANTQGLYFYIDGTLTTALKAAFVAPCALTVTNVKAKVATAPTGADLILDIHKNGTTIFSTQGNRPTIAATETSEDSAAPDVTSIAAGDLIKLEIDQIGSTIAGEDLSVTVVCEAT